MRRFSQWLLVLVASSLLAACGPKPPAVDGGTGGGAGGGGGDTVAPLVVETTPATGSTSVTVGTSLVVKFSEAMAPSSVSVTLTPAGAVGPPTASDGDTTFTWQPTATLAYETAFTATVDGTDVAGNALAGLKTFSFTTEQTPDTEPPTVVAFLPAGGAVALSSEVRITFSEPMDPGSITVTLDPAADLGMPTFNSAVDQATFALATPFLPSTTYTATVAGEDVGGNALAGTTTFTFTTTTAPDTEPPTVLSVSPPDGQTNVPRGTNVSIQFSEAMNTVQTQAAFTVTKEGGASPVPGTVAWTTEGDLLTFDPTTDLEPEATYHVMVSPTARDEAGNTLASAFTAQFRTAQLPDTTPPRVTGITPASGSNGVPNCDWRFVLTFSEPMDQRSVSSSLSVSQTVPTSITAGLSLSWNSAGTQLTVTRRTIIFPSVCFTHGGTVRVSVTGGANDLAGNNLETAFLATYTIMRESTVTLTPHLDGYVMSNGTVWGGVGLLGMGDEPTNQYGRAFMSFSLASLPSTATITDAVFRVRWYLMHGSPFVNLGALRLEHVNFSSTLTGSDLMTSVLTTCTTVPPPKACTKTEFSIDFATNTWSGYRSANVTRTVYDDWVNRSTRGSRAQLRLRFLTNYSANGVADNLIVYGRESTSPEQLVVTYEYP